MTYIFCYKLNKKLRKELSDDAKSKYGDIRFKLKSKKTKI